MHVHRAHTKHKTKTQTSIAFVYQYHVSSILAAFTVFLQAFCCCCKKKKNKTVTVCAAQVIWKFANYIHIVCVCSVLWFSSFQMQNACYRTAKLLTTAKKHTFNGNNNVKEKENKSRRRASCIFAEWKMVYWNFFVAAVVVVAVILNVVIIQTGRLLHVLCGCMLCIAFCLQTYQSIEQAWKSIDMNKERKELKISFSFVYFLALQGRRGTGWKANRRQCVRHIGLVENIVVFGVCCCNHLEISISKHCLLRQRTKW